MSCHDTGLKGDRGCAAHKSQCAASCNQLHVEHCCRHPKKKMSFSLHSCSRGRFRRWMKGGVSGGKFTQPDGRCPDRVKSNAPPPPPPAHVQQPWAIRRITKCLDLEPFGEARVTLFFYFIDAWRQRPTEPQISCPHPQQVSILKLLSINRAITSS